MKAWIETVQVDDRAFLWLLMSLRGWVLSDKVYHPLKREYVEHFMDYDGAIARLDTIGETASGEDAAQVEEIRKSIALAREDDE